MAHATHEYEHRVTTLNDINLSILRASRTSANDTIGSECEKIKHALYNISDALSSYVASILRIVSPETLEAYQEQNTQLNASVRSMIKTINDLEANWKNASCAVDACEQWFSRNS